MSEAFVRTAYDAIFAFNVTAPGSGSAYAQVAALLSAPQLAEIVPYVIVRLDIFTPTQAINYQHGSAAGVVDPNTAPMPVNANQKPNESLPVALAHLVTYLRSQAAGTATVSVILYGVNAGSL